MRQYIGARYMPKFMGTYDATTAYEALSVVDNGLGTSYISNKPVPAGTPLTDGDYWMIYGASSGAILDLQDRMTDVETDLQYQYTLHNRKYVLIGDRVNFPSLSMITEVDSPRISLSTALKLGGVLP